MHVSQIMMQAGNVFSARLPKKKIYMNFSGFVVKTPRIVFTSIWLFLSLLSGCFLVKTLF